MAGVVVATNIRILKRTRKQVQPGDAFAVGLPDGSFLLGRVVSTDAQWTLAVGADPAILIYLYRERSTTKELPDRSTMRPDRLLVSPIMTNRVPWTLVPRV